MGALVLAILASSGCDAEPASRPSEPVATAPIGDIERGRELVVRFECNRCHVISRISDAAAPSHCVSCHQEIREGTFRASPEALARWQRNIVSLVDVPALTSVGARLRPEWIADFLTSPHDLRPGLIASMPRLEIDAAQARDMAAFLASDSAPAPASPVDRARGTISEGRRLLDTRGCGSCHAFNGVEPLRASALPVAISAERRAIAARLAPDLRATRARFTRASLVRWLRSPSRTKPDTPMPDIPLTEHEAQSIATYLLRAPLTDPEHLDVASVPAPLERPVAFAEVDERIFRRTCRHCHADPDYALGDGGPGNTGGFGFAPRRLNLATYEGVSSGYLDGGRRRSVFAPDEDGTPRLVRALLARHHEIAGHPIDGVRGMPLGLPPVPIEDIQLLVTWIAQGRPR